MGYNDLSVADGLWISPTGRKFSVVEHIQFIQQNPGIFGLDEGDVDITGLDRETVIFKLGNIAMNLIGKGWIRYRLFDITHNFEVNNVNAAKKRILDVIGNVAWPVGELVEITTLYPSSMFKETVDQFIKSAATKRSYPSAAHKRWAFSYRLGDRKSNMMHNSEGADLI